MKMLIYYGSMVALFVLCMVGVSFLMAGIEQLFALQLGRMLMNFGFIAGIGMFFLLKPAVKKLLSRYDIK